MITPPTLAGAKWLISRRTQAVFAMLAAAGHEGRAVGGCVRNGLMGLPVADIDIATTALPGETSAAAKAAGMAAIPTGIEHGTITVAVGGRPYEVTTLRRDLATDGRRAVVAFSRDWGEDASRRDFTMNALYCGADGTVFDPLGGYGDLAARRVRFIGDPSQRIQEDYLRILRFFRFHATYGVGELDRAGAIACVRLRDGLRRLSAERIGGEMLKLLAAPFAVAAINEMFDLGLLVDVLAAAPRLQRLERLAALQSSPPDPVLRLAALAVHVEEDAERLAMRLRLSGAQRAVLALRGSILTATSTVHQARVVLHRLGPEDYRRGMLLAWANSNDPPSDARWRTLLALPEHAPIPPFPISGRDLVALGVSPGPQVGAMLQALERRWIDADFSPDRDTLLTLTHQLIVRFK